MQHIQKPLLSIMEPKAEKVHLACDECRSRKLKCSGERPKCSRCRLESMQCVYSIQKRMGRPRKRKKGEAEEDRDADSILYENGYVPKGIPNNGHAMPEQAPSGSYVIPPFRDGDFGSFGVDDFGFDANGHRTGGHANGPMQAHPQHAPVNGHVPGTNGSSAQPLWTPNVSTEKYATPPDHDSINAPLTCPPMPQNMMYAANTQQHSPIHNPTPTHVPFAYTSHGHVAHSPPTVAGSASPPAMIPTPTSMTMNPSCACLSNAYLTNSNLQSLNHTFPFVLPQIRAAIATATEIMQCEYCPKEPGSAMQNMFTMATLLNAIVDQIRKILVAIDEEAANVEATHGTKRFQMGDDSPDARHMHTGTPDCPARFPIELSGNEWRTLAKNVVKTQIVGSPEDPTTLLGVIHRLKQRQTSWHANKERANQILGSFSKCSADEKGEFTCMRMIRMTREMIDVLEW